MRRFFSILLLLLLMVPLVSPLLAASTADANVPICCRRNGKHHCIMTAAVRSSSNSITRNENISLRESCPYTLTTFIAINLSFVPYSVQSAIFASNVSNPTPLRKTEVKHCLSIDGSHQKRGPPSLIAS